MYERGDQKKFAIWAVILLVLEYIAMGVTFGLEISGTVDFPTAFNTFRLGGYCKALITFVKYCPQVYLNFRRKSTVGWSIINIMLDFTGGSCSILQQVFQFVDAGLENDHWDFFDPSNSGDAFNIVKFLLGVIAVFFDIIFLVQHYCLYRNRHDAALMAAIRES